MSEEITRRVEQIPFQHRDELLENLLWFAQTGEQAIPAMLKGLKDQNAKVRSSCAWVLGRMRDRRTIPDLQKAVRDEDLTVRMECARTLLLMGDLAWTPTLIEGLDHDRKEVRYMSHEALKSATGHDFGYDHLNQNQNEMRLSVLRWRQWWSEYSGDTFFAQQYQQEHNLTPAAPTGETQPGKQEPAPKTPAQPANTPANAPTTPTTDTGDTPATDTPAAQPNAPKPGTTTKPAAPGTKPAATKPVTPPAPGTAAPGTTTTPPADETATTPPAPGTGTTPRQPGSANSTSSTTPTTTPARR